MRSIVLASVALLSATSCARGQEQPAASQACATAAEPWKAARGLRSAADATGAAQARFAIGEAVRLTLHPDGEVAYLTLPQGEGEAASFGGMASFTVEQTGTYSVGVSEPSWVDVVQDGKPAEAIRFGPGTPCSGMRKAVAFRLEPGTHVLELSGNSGPELGVLVMRAP